MRTGAAALFFLSATLLCCPQTAPDKAPSSILDSAHDSLALQHIPSRAIKDDDIKQISTEIPGYQIRRTSALEKLGFVLLDRIIGRGDFADQSVTRFLEKHTCWHWIPVEKKGSLFRVPINQIVVKFKPSKPVSEIRKLLSEDFFEIVEEPSEAFPGRYVVLFNDIATKGPQKAQDLASNEELVEYAVAQALSIENPRPFY